MTKEELTAQVESIVRQVVDSVLESGNGHSETHKRGEVPVQVSARHLHITQEHLEILFGKGHTLTKMRDLVQPGEFAAKETVGVVGPRRRVIEKVRILGPTRPRTQVELSFTDGIQLGIDLPHRISGDIDNSAPIDLIGPEGMLHLDEGAIRAMRHMHIPPELAKEWGIENGQTVDVRTEGDAAVTFHGVLARYLENGYLRMHIDTDEANAAGLSAREEHIGFIV